MSRYPVISASGHVCIIRACTCINAVDSASKQRLGTFPDRDDDDDVVIGLV